MVFRRASQILAVFFVMLCVCPITAPFSIWDTPAPISQLHEESLSTAKIAQEPPAMAVCSLGPALLVSCQVIVQLTIAVRLVDIQPRSRVLRI